MVLIRFSYIKLVESKASARAGRPVGRNPPNHKIHFGVEQFFEFPRPREYGGEVDYK